MDENIFYPELTLETDDIIMELTIKKDYSKIRDSDKRKCSIRSDRERIFCFGLCRVLSAGKI